MLYCTQSPTFLEDIMHRICVLLILFCSWLYSAEHGEKKTALEKRLAQLVDAREGIEADIKKVTAQLAIMHSKPKERTPLPGVRDVFLPQTSPGEEAAFIEREQRCPTRMTLLQHWEMSQELEGGAWRAVTPTPEQQAEHDARWPQPEDYNPYKEFSAYWEKYKLAFTTAQKKYQKSAQEHANAKKLEKTKACHKKQGTSQRACIDTAGLELSDIPW